MYYYDDYIKDVKRITDMYRNIISIVDSAQSYDKRDIYALKLGRGKICGIISAGVHGREYVNTPALMNVIKEYLYKYYSLSRKNTRNEYVDLQNKALIIVPLLNPDGYEIALRGYNVLNDSYLRKICISRNINYTEWKENARGIDINRNFDSITWKQKSKEDYPFSEVESQFMKMIFDKYYGGIYIDIHSRGKNIYYYRKSMNDIYNYRQKIIAKDISSFTKYRLSDEQEEINVGDSGGNTVHYYSEKYNCPALTIETVKEDETFPLDYRNVDKIYEEIYHLLDYMLNYEI